MSSYSPGRGGAIGDRGIEAMLHRIEAVEMRAEKFEKQYNALLQERNNRVAVEDEIDEHLERLESHEKKTDSELRRLERGFEELVSTFHAGVVEEVAQELADFRQIAVAPIEAELRASLKSDLEPMRRQMDRCEADQANFERTIERTHAERFERVERAVERNFDELTETTAALTNEQHDHREAIGNLMDMLEGSVTQDDLSQVSPCDVCAVYCAASSDLCCVCVCLRDLSRCREPVRARELCGVLTQPPWVAGHRPARAGDPCQSAGRLRLRGGARRQAGQHTHHRN